MSPMWVQRSAQDAQGGPLFPLAVSLSLPVSLSFSLCLSLLSPLSLLSTGSTKAGSRTLAAFLDSTMRRRNQKEAERMNSYPGGPLDQEASVEREQGEAGEEKQVCGKTSFSSLSQTI